MGEIPDPEAKKPDDWDEDAPKEIEDMDTSKPDDWDEDAEEKIPDPAASKPDDWDEDEDGPWEAPLIENPQCKTGCGPWKRPMKAASIQRQVECSYDQASGLQGC